MTEMLDETVETAHEHARVRITVADDTAIASSGAVACGALATDEDMRALRAKYGL